MHNLSHELATHCQRLLEACSPQENYRHQSESSRMATGSRSLPRDGHIVCHPRYTAFSTRTISFSNTRIEREADEFAECLMAYRYDLDEYYVRRFLAEGWRP